MKEWTSKLQEGLQLLGQEDAAKSLGDAINALPDGYAMEAGFGGK